jgi:acyl carrier protein
MMTVAKAQWENRMVQLIAEVSVVRAENIRPEHRLREDLGMDSVCSLELISMLAEEFGLNISVEEAAQIVTVRGALDMAGRHMARASS